MEEDVGGFLELCGQHQLEAPELRDPLVIPTEKPPVPYENTSSTAEDLAAHIIRTPTPDTARVLEYLVKLASKMSEVTPRELKSYTILIAAAGAAVSPLSWVKPVPTETGDDNAARPAPRDLPAKYHIKALFRIMAPQRLTRAKNEEYKSALIAKLKEGYSAITLSGDPAADLAIENLWDKDPYVVRMIAAYDMFLFLFKDHPYAEVRLTTVTMRDNDLTVYKALCELLYQSKLTFASFAPWIWSKDAAKEYMRVVNNATVGHQNKACHIHYAKAFGMCTVSPHAIAGAPLLYTYICLLGLSMNISRSRNAALPKNVNVNDVLAGAYYFSYVFGGIAGLTMTFPGQATNAQQMGIRGQQEEDKDGGRWLSKAWIGHKAHAARAAFFRVVTCATANNVREGSILEYIAQSRTVLMAAKLPGDEDQVSEAESEEDEDASED